MNYIVRLLFVLYNVKHVLERPNAVLQVRVLNGFNKITGVRQPQRQVRRVRMDCTQTQI
jgi:hypothetical protein